MLFRKDKRFGPFPEQLMIASTVMFIKVLRCLPVAQTWIHRKRTIN